MPHIWFLKIFVAPSRTGVDVRGVGVVPTPPRRENRRRAAVLASRRVRESVASDLSSMPPNAPKRVLCTIRCRRPPAQARIRADERRRSPTRCATDRTAEERMSALAKWFEVLMIPTASTYVLHHWGTCQKLSRTTAQLFRTTYIDGIYNVYIYYF